MYHLKRISKTPSSPMRILVDQADGDDAGLCGGGSFYFGPAGQDGDEHGMSEHAARVIMSDPGLAEHFTCTPALPKLTKTEKQARVETKTEKPAKPAQDATKDQKAGETLADRKG